MRLARGCRTGCMRRRRSGRGSRSGRGAYRLVASACGFALVELLAALIITSVLGAAVFRLVDRSQRFARGVATLADQRAQLAVATFAVDGALQAVAAGDGDLVAGSDSSVVYQGNVGSAVACAVSGATFDVADQRLASGATLTWWNTAPQPGDSLALFDEGATSAASDDRWHHSAIATVAGRTNACLHTVYLDSIADAGSVGWRVTTTAPIPSSVAPGAVVRFTRPERFALYRSSGEWMLGWSEWSHGAATWNTIQPVAGPLLPYASGTSTSGFRITWFDSSGAVVAPAPGVAARSATLSLGATTRVAVRVDGIARGARRDSVTHRVLLRSLP